MTINGAQVREARNLLGWSQAKLAKKSKVTGGKIADCESGQALLEPFAAIAIRRALQDGGIEFTSGGWPVIMLKPQ